MSGRKFAGVRVVQPGASSNTGRIDLPVPELGADSSQTDPAKKPAGTREGLAVIALFGGHPVCLGFLPPRRSQMYLEAGRRIDRHQSDVYSTIDAEGNTEWRHPSGTMVRISESATPEDLTGQDTDGAWKIDKNTARAPRLHVRLANGGQTKFELVATPDGNVTMTVAGTLTVNAPTTNWTGDINVSGDITVTGGDVVADGISLKTHVHGGVQSGGSNTGQPV
ncbi:hypothetical protein [Methylocaldum sp. MU1018]